MAGWVALATGYLHAYLAMYQRVPLALDGMGVGAVSPRVVVILLGSLAVASLEHGLDPRLVAAVMMVESSGNPAATNGRCVGLMQVNVPVWQRALSLDEARMTEPLYNLRAGCRILRHYLDIEQDDVRRALRRYHGARSWRYAERVLRVWEGSN